MKTLLNILISIILFEFNYKGFKTEKFIVIVSHLLNKTKPKIKNFENL